MCRRGAGGFAVDERGRKMLEMYDVAPRMQGFIWRASISVCYELLHPDERQDHSNHRLGYYSIAIIRGKVYQQIERFVIEPHPGNLRFPASEFPRLPPLLSLHLSLSLFLFLHSSLLHSPSPPLDSV